MSRGCAALVEAGQREALVGRHDRRDLRVPAVHREHLLEERHAGVGVERPAARVRDVTPGAVGLPAAQDVRILLRPVHHQLELLVEELRLHRRRRVARAAAVRHHEGVHHGRFDRARSFTVWTVFAASASGSGLFVSGDVGTQESTVAVVAESRNSSLR